MFGDIGTSLIYRVQTVFNTGDPHPVTVSTDSVFGIVSLIFWSVTIIVTVTYVFLVMRADNDGEGGIMALITLIRRPHEGGSSSRTRRALAALGIFGASLFLGDSMITPAISVLLAVEGLKVPAPSLEHLIVPITAAIIVGLFLLQRVGTAAVGRLFGPVMLLSPSGGSAKRARSASSSTSSVIARRPSNAHPELRCSSTARRSRPRWRCAPPSSISTRSTSTS